LSGRALLPGVEVKHHGMDGRCDTHVSGGKLTILKKNMTEEVR
jgi:hypothetical protein